LLTSGIDFINNNGNDGVILLISNSDQYGDDDVANTFINDILALMDVEIPIFIADYQSTNYSYEYINGRYFNGNEYFYSNLSKITIGSLKRVRNDLTFNKTISESFANIGGCIKSFDLYTKPTNGYCHSRFDLMENYNVLYLNEPIQQIGRFEGDSPFSINVTGEYNGEVFSKNIILEDDDIYECDSILEKIWVAQSIKSLEMATQNNDLIDDIIALSTENRVLSSYTSFLCLETKDYICYDCLDETSPSSISEIEMNDSLKVYPNPITDLINIDFHLKGNEKLLDLAILDVNGKCIHKFNTALFSAGENHISYNLTNSNGLMSSKGIYLLNFTTTEKKRIIKLIKK
jgi:hypothetical protein